MAAKNYTCLSNSCLDKYWGAGAGKRAPNGRPASDSFKKEAESPCRGRTMGPMKLNIRTFSFAAALLAAVLAASQTTGTAPQGDLIALENRYITAMVEANRADLEKLLAPDYLSVAATGDVFDRAQTLGFYRPGELRGASAAEMKVRVYGVTAVVIG